MTVRTDPRDNELVRAVALERVAKRRVAQAILRASTQPGVTQGAISDIVGVSQAQVNRRLKELRRSPELLERSPADAINERAADVISTEEMMEQLRTWTYTFGSVATENGSATDAYERGTWDDVEAAYRQKLLSDNEMQELLDIHGDKIVRAARR